MSKYNHFRTAFEFNKGIAGVLNVIFKAYASAPGAVAGMVTLSPCWPCQYASSPGLPSMVIEAMADASNAPALSVVMVAVAPLPGHARKVA